MLNVSLYDEDFLLGFALIDAVIQYRGNKTVTVGKAKFHFDRFDALVEYFLHRVHAQTFVGKIFRILVIIELKINK